MADSYYLNEFKSFLVAGLRPTGDSYMGIEAPELKGPFTFPICNYVDFAPLMIAGDWLMDHGAECDDYQRGINAIGRAASFFPRRAVVQGQLIPGSHSVVTNLWVANQTQLITWVVPLPFWQPFAEPNILRIAIQISCPPEDYNPEHTARSCPLSIGHRWWDEWRAKDLVGFMERVISEGGE